MKTMKSFLLLWGSQSLSALGSSMTSYALILWVYSQQGTATSLALMSFFTFLPSTLLCFAAGTLADRWDKKKTMLASDLVAVLGTAAVFALHATGTLRVHHLYFINFLISLMNAFQSPASYVATSLLVPIDQYVRASGLQSFSGSLVSLLTPALATVLLAFFGLEAIILIDLITFATAFCTLAFGIRLPALPRSQMSEKSGFLAEFTEGFRFLCRHRALLGVILFFALINLIAYVGSAGGVLPAMVLSRGGGEVALGFVSAALGAGMLTGSVLVTIMKPAKNRLKTVIASCALSFLLADPLLALGRSPWVWALAAFAGNLPLPFLNANLSAFMRENVPLEMQGRVFSARDTLQYATIPIGMFMSGCLADRVFEPFMAGGSRMAGALSALVGTGSGAGIALMFLLTGLCGFLACVIYYRKTEQ